MESIPSPLRIARSLLQVYYAYMVEYRAELLLWVLSGSLPLILMGVWQQAAQNGEFSLNSLAFAHYFLAVFITRQCTVVWVIWDFERDVVQGKLSLRLLQPLDPAWHYLGTHVAERFARLPFIALLVGLFFALYPQSFWVPALPNLGLFLGAVILAFSLRFLMQYTFAMLAFWTERATALEETWFLFYLFLSGMVAPLDVFPDTMAAIVHWTPFPYLVYFPAALLLGLPMALGESFAIFIGWIVVFWLLNRWLWRRGLGQYSGMGA
jgi:ABC-2 type transport system permease protein